MKSIWIDKVKEDVRTLDCRNWLGYPV